VSPGNDVRAILLDIEGTTSPISFVSQTLFPYARRHLRAYLEARGRASEYGAFVQLMNEDSKSTSLKELQGRIWEAGYRSGHLTGEMFADVEPALRRWKQRDIAVGIFSSGSVLAQQFSSATLRPAISGRSFAGTSTPTSEERETRRAIAGSRPRSAYQRRASSLFRTW
jgi:enolase-phosphatase E1